MSRKNLQRSLGSAVLVSRLEGTTDIKLLLLLLWMEEPLVMLTSRQTISEEPVLYKFPQNAPAV